MAEMYAGLPQLPAAICASCHHQGKAVSGQTVKALLAASLREVADGPYLFCPTPTCRVVYFAADHSHHFTTDQLRERVYQKVPTDPTVWACYCFRHTVGDIHMATLADRQAIIVDIMVGIQAGQCACDLRNPQGACCLGNVRSLAKHE
ncbi:MAG: copper chaperone Copz family protein [Herpetosiphonaceae bacterium]|nr:copper chaperone Copz family protein [Herpetosiphonaceae bacterium]